MGGLLEYLDVWTMKIVTPFCIIWSLKERKKSRVAFFVTLQVVLFGFSSHKSVLFSAFVVVFFYILFDFIVSKSHYLPLSFNALLIWPLYCRFSGSTGILVGLFNRVMVTPAVINFNFYEYFYHNGFDWFRQSFLRHFTTSKFDLLLPKLIGLEYYNNAAINANTGFLGSGYAQGGMVVLVIYSIIIGLMISLIDSFSAKISPKLVCSIMLLPMMSLFTSGDLPSSIVTGGIFICFILLYVLSKDPLV